MELTLIPNDPIQKIRFERNDKLRKQATRALNILQGDQLDRRVHVS
jgi:hypothetical protein